MVYDLGIIFYVWIWSLLIQLIVGSYLLLRLKGNFVDGGWAFGRIVGWLLLGLSIWFLGHLQIPINTLSGVNVVMVLILGCIGYEVIKKRKELRKELKQKWLVILIEEILFLLGLLGMSLIRGFNPNILDLEKFMDVGFMNSYLQASTLPAGDMWLSGESINYYSFGHFLGAIMTRLWQVKMSYGYNLLLGWLMGLGLSQSFSVIVNTTSINRIKNKLGYNEIAGGLIGILLVMIGGNSHSIWYWLVNRDWVGYWYADATRFIENTIHEFPSYSFVVSDLHAHVWDIPIVLLYLLMMIGFIKETKNKWVWGGFLGGILGIMMMTNTWDFLVYGLLGGIVAILMLVNRKISLRILLKTGVFAFGVMVLIGLPWILNFDSIGEGVRWVEKRSPVHDLLVLWSGHVTLSLLALGFAIKKRNFMLMGLVVTALLLLMIPEVVYVKDIYPGHPRANTMFKLTYQAFILMGLSIGTLIGMLVSPKSKLLVGSLVLVGVGAFLSYPIFAFPGYYGEFKTYIGLDGEKWLKERYPGDYEAIKWLRRHATEHEVVLEAVGESYTDYARVSAYSGLQTVLGWRVHEWLWRGGFDIPAERTEEVKAMFEDSRERQGLLLKHKIKYIFLGVKERETYQINESELKSLGDVVFEMGETKIIELKY